MRIHEIAEWLLIADEDTVSAEILNKENNLVNSYYHCSQAVEKYLIGKKIYIKKTVNDNDIGTIKYGIPWLRMKNGFVRLE